ncbi:MULTISPECIES: CatB-related O-acetyltransferase [Lactobacillaceae]|uniref:CatB-related O-acetyltransferase n=1 Tax=Lactobacillaceae TaxID=33958 RepID=UPI001B3B2B8D|nr:CatB-related O-acetyltransferase [Lactobacillus sp. HBUAS51381]
MPTTINGVTFFQNKLTATRSHRNRLLTFNQDFADLLTQHHIYTTARKRATHRISLNSLVRVPLKLQIEPYSMFLVGQQLFSMGAFSSSNSVLPVNSIVGRYSSIATKVSRMQGSHPTDRFTTSMLTYDTRVSAFNDYLTETGKSFDHVPNPIPNGGPIIIGNDVWIGQDVRFAPTGITVGDGAVVAGGALVTKNVPPYAIVGGVPARVIKYRFPRDIIEKLLKLKWWQYGFADFHGISPDAEIEDFIYQLSDLIAADKLHPFAPESVTFENFAKTNNLQQPETVSPDTEDHDI